MTDSTVDNQNDQISGTNNVKRSQEKVCEYMFPISEKELIERTLRNKASREEYERSRSRTGGNSSELKASNRSYSDTGGISIYIFKNNDPFFLGKKMLVTEKIYRNWEQFLISVIKTVDLVKSSCRIVNLTDGKEIFDCSELVDGEKYVALSKNEKLNLNINYRTSRENKEYQLQKEMEEQKKIKMMNEKYRKKKNHWIYRREQQRLNDLENKREVIEQDDENVEDCSKKRELLKKFRLERIDQEEKRIRYKQKNREIGNKVINRSLVTVEPEKVFDRETKGYRIYLHKNGDYLSTGKCFILNFNNSSSLLAMILSIRETLSTEFWFARRIFDINTFKRIQKIEEIEDEKHYIITGKELPRRDQPYKTEPEEAVTFDPKIIHVYPNGDGLSIPMNVRVTPQKFQTIEKLTRFLDGNIHLITGCIKILYDMSGKKITSIDQLENEKEYVAASYNEPFYNIKYNVNCYKKKHYRTSNDDDLNRNESMSRERSRNRSRSKTRNESRGRSMSKTEEDTEARSRSVSVSKTEYEGRERSRSKTGDESIYDDKEKCTIIKNHSRAASDFKDINKTDPDSLRRVKTEQGTSLRSGMKSEEKRRPSTTFKQTDEELKSCLNKTKGLKDKQNVVIDSKPEIFSEDEGTKKVAEYHLGKPDTVIDSKESVDPKEEILKQFTSEPNNTNHNLSMPRKTG